ncbi:uncharacterized protein Tco025E_01107 [Trypanosoma conorhini]|uniref:Uncharacterized protein n=1 Tax=Trypanosoma conorhini TaxID=83891 RepID=A0A422Q9K9_9TRYP|nr:uncharacterized protein Tco025E_01107 [Trypanosoma conorhini]RNF26645.1 hypothetical protein Tco025E_01107 [Trypanosoma conorhini]
MGCTQAKARQGPTRPTEPAPAQQACAPRAEAPPLLPGGGVAVPQEDQASVTHVEPAVGGAAATEEATEEAPAAGTGESAAHAVGLVASERKSPRPSRAPGRLQRKLAAAAAPSSGEWWVYSARRNKSCAWDSDEPVSVCVSNTTASSPLFLSQDRRNVGDTSPRAASAPYGTCRGCLSVTLSPMSSAFTSPRVSLCADGGHAGRGPRLHSLIVGVGAAAANTRLSTGANPVSSARRECGVDAENHTDGAEAAARNGAAQGARGSGVAMSPADAAGGRTSTSASTAAAPSRGRFVEGSATATNVAGGCCLKKEAEGARSCTTANDISCSCRSAEETGVRLSSEFQVPTIARLQEAIRRAQRTQ